MYCTLAKILLRRRERNLIPIQPNAGADSRLILNEERAL